MVSDIIENPEPSEELEHNEGRVSQPTDLAQAIVADRYKRQSV